MIVGEREEEFIKETSDISCGNISCGAAASVEGADRRNGVAADLLVVEGY